MQLHHTGYSGCPQRAQEGERSMGNRGQRELNNTQNLKVRLTMVQVHFLFETAVRGKKGGMSKVISG